MGTHGHPWTLASAALLYGICLLSILNTFPDKLLLYSMLLITTTACCLWNIRDVFPALIKMSRNEPTVDWVLLVKQGKICFKELQRERGTYNCENSMSGWVYGLFLLAVALPLLLSVLNTACEFHYLVIAVAQCVPVRPHVDCSLWE